VNGVQLNGVLNGDRGSMLTRDAFYFKVSWIVYFVCV